MNLPEGFPDHPTDCPRLDFPVNEVTLLCPVKEVLIERNMKGVTVVDMSLPERFPDRPADCPWLDFPVDETTSQILIAPPCDPETTRLPSGENATDVTQSVCPSNGPLTTSCICVSRILTVLSHDPETMRLPSGENATDVTQSSCPSNGPLLYLLSPHPRS